MISTFIIAATSLDGFISPLESTSSMNWTSGADKEFFKTKTKEAGVVVIGRKTFETIGKALPDRKTIVYSRSPIDIEGVEVTDLEPKNLLEKLESEGYTKVAVCGGSSIYSLFLESKCISKVYITLEPIIFGQGISIFNTETKTKLELISSTSLDSDTILLEYNITK